MAPSRATTPAGRRRASRRASTGRGARHGAGPAAKSAGKRPATKPAKRRQPAKTARPAATRRKPAKPRTAPAKPKRPAVKPRPARPLAERAPRLLLIAGVVVVALAATYLAWFRNSSFVAVEEVTVGGMSGPQKNAVEAALTNAATEMTTLNLDEDALGEAVEGFATVSAVAADVDFPKAVAITVTERPPVLLVRADGGSQPVAGDGTVLAGVETEGLRLPGFRVPELAAGGRVSGDVLEIALVLGAAPTELRELVEKVSIGGPEGVEVTLRGGVPLYFGGSEQAAAKWEAAAAVLADPKIETLTYVDLRVPERPAVGGAAPTIAGSTTETTEPETGPTAVPAAEPVPAPVPETGTPAPVTP